MALETVITGFNEYVAMWQCITLRYGDTVQERGREQAVNQAPAEALSSRRCDGRQLQHLCVFVCGYVQLFSHALLRCFPPGGRILKDKSWSQWEDPRISLCQWQILPISSVTSFLLVALISVTDLFLKLGADMSKTVIMPLLLFPLQEGKMVTNLETQPGKARSWVGLLVVERLSCSMAAFALPLSENVLSPGTSLQTDASFCYCFCCTVSAWDMVRVWSKTSITVEV